MVLNAWFNPHQQREGIHPTAVIAESASIGKNVFIGPYVVIEDDAVNPLPSIPSRVGLGTKILNLVSDGRWSISRNGAKTTVKLTMSLLETEMR